MLAVVEQQVIERDAIDLGLRRLLTLPFIGVDNVTQIGLFLRSQAKVGDFTARHFDHLPDRLDGVRVHAWQSDYTLRTRRGAIAFGARWPLGSLAPRRR